MALLTVYAATPTGTQVTPVTPTAATGDTFVNDGATKFWVKNASGGSINVTIKSPNTCSFGLSNNAAHDIVVAVPAGQEKAIGPFPVDRFNDASGLVTAICSSVASVTVAAIK